MEQQKWSLDEIIDYARKNSPFYRELYSGVSYGQITDLPITEQAQFWKGDVLTSTEREGIVFKSGGSTGAPKFSYFTSLEWQSFTSIFGWGINQGIIDDKDRIANLFYVGDLYSSFIFIKDSLQSIPVESKKLLQVPIAGATDPHQILKTLEEFCINVIAGVPSSLLTLLEFYEKEKNKYPLVKIGKILFAGESLYPDQKEALIKMFPDVKIASIGYASVDAGLLGYSDRSCGDGEHRPFDGANIIEIVDTETSEVIREVNRVGRVLITNLTRKLMPIIRYPAGDLAEWIEDEGVPHRKFKLQGRSDEAARLGTISVYFEDTRDMIKKTLSEFSGLQFQMVLEHYQNKDELILRIAGIGPVTDLNIVERVIIAFEKEKVTYGDLLSRHLIHPVKVEIVEMYQLESNGRTGKLKRVIDRRSL
ncbi:MAG: phenylacetate--CoA ligase family protein [Bacteriovorax sp.]|nr:phenylacetate--CoA ligase family protein [Bacteriovorax sp.]